MDKVLTEGELRQIDKALLLRVGSVEGEGLRDQMDLDAGSVQGHLHLLETLQSDEGVKVAVDTHCGRGRIT